MNIGQLVQYVQKAEQSDESGDATLVRYLKEVLPPPHIPLDDLLRHFLFWSLGKDWQEQIDSGKYLES